MTNRIQALGKKLRRVGVNLWEDPKSPVNLRPFKPGVHGRKKTRTSPYLLMLTEKQKIKLYYEISEKRLHKVFDKALKNRQANIFDSFMGALEVTLQTFVYRMKWARSMAAARQLVTHRHILVDGQVLNIKSAELKPGQKVSLSTEAREFKAILESQQSAKVTPEYIHVDGPFEGHLTRIPTFAENPASKVLNPKAIINLMR